VEKSSHFAIRPVPSHSRGKQLAGDSEPLFGRRVTLGIGHHRWLRSGVWQHKLVSRTQEIEECHQNEVGQILRHVTHERIATSWCSNDSAGKSLRFE
jgi:hypothetical protein